MPDDTQRLLSQLAALRSIVDQQSQVFVETLDGLPQLPFDDPETLALVAKICAELNESFVDFRRMQNVVTDFAIWIARAREGKPEELKEMMDRIGDEFGIDP